MNFPQMPPNPEIPALKLKSVENAGKILLEWTG
jgi:O-antigen ligase